jgi:hypothetical protein
MRRILTPSLLLSILLLPLAGGAVPGLDASAAGTTSFTVHDWTTGRVVCDTHAVFAFETTGGAGLLAWDAPECEGPWSPGVVPLAFWCTDACFNDCWLTPEEVRCYPRGVWVGEWPPAMELTLRRDGEFHFTWYAADGAAMAEAHGTLLVTTWPGHV